MASKDTLPAIGGAFFLRRSSLNLMLMSPACEFGGPKLAIFATKK